MCFLLFHSPFEHLSPSALAAKSPLCLSNHVDILLLKCLSCHTDGGTKKSGAFLEDMDRCGAQRRGGTLKSALFSLRTLFRAASVTLDRSRSIRNAVRDRVEVRVVGAVNQNLFTEKESGNRGSKYSEGKGLFGDCSKGE